MKFITVRDLRTSPAQVWKQLLVEQEMIITNNGKPIALLTPISDATLEDTLKTVRRARAMNAVKSMQAAAMKRGLPGLTKQDIDSEIRQVRRNKNRDK
ncbi:MAG: type II toxin-antitoxin system Phd/YefM family antitoxin [Spirochaetes bacterium]|nr:type II toxin-antitoxin system Phd/YefM family antitoxin [Spirochaetota bacterium]